MGGGRGTVQMQNYCYLLRETRVPAASMGWWPWFRGVFKSEQDFADGSDKFVFHNTTSQWEKINQRRWAFKIRPIYSRWGQCWEKVFWGRTEHCPEKHETGRELHAAVYQQSMVQPQGDGPSRSWRHRLPGPPPGQGLRKGARLAYGPGEDQAG